MPQSGTCACGCGGQTNPAPQTHTASGWVKGEPLKTLPGHGRRVGRSPRREDHGYTTPCLIWQGKPSAQGYGRVFVDGKTKPAHVARWEAVNGPVPEGHELDHLCYVRLCVELGHLECVTKAENRSRAAKRMHAARVA